MAEDFYYGIPIEQCRGIETTDTNDQMIIIRASVESVVNAFSLLQSVTAWDQDIYKREIEVPDSGILIFQFVGHYWTIIHGFYSLPRQGDSHSIFASVGESEASLLSASLQTRSIDYKISDTGGYIGYHLFDSGQSIERFFYTEESEELNNEEDWSGTYQFQSLLRQMTKKEIGYPRRFVDRFIREQGTYIPYFPDFWYTLHVGERVTLQEVVKKNVKIERMDCLTVSL